MLTRMSFRGLGIVDGACIRYDAPSLRGAGRRAHFAARARKGHGRERQGDAPVARAPHRAGMSRTAARRAYTLVELVVVLALLALGAGAAVRGVTALLDRTAAEGAARDLAFLFHRARDRALLRAARVTVRLDTVAATIALHERDRPPALRDLAGVHGVTLTATRDSMTYLGTGLATGGANLTAIVRRGAAAETVIVSRLGRIRRP